MEKKSPQHPPKGSGPFFRQYLKYLIDHNTTVHVYLSNGARITGKLDACDSEAIFVETSGKGGKNPRQVMIRNQSIVSVQPEKPKSEIIHSMRLEQIRERPGSKKED